MDHPPLAIREADEKDFDEILKIGELSWEVWGRPSRRDLEKMIVKHPGGLMVGLYGSRIIGFSSGYPTPPVIEKMLGRASVEPDKMSCYHVEYLAVHPDYRDNHVDGLLLEKQHERARGLGHEIVFLHALRSMRDYYEKQGYQSEGSLDGNFKNLFWRKL